MKFQTLDLGGLKAAMARVVDEAAETERRRYITPGDGQMLAYQRKEAEARAYLADGSIGPHLRAEMERTGLSALHCANLIAAKADEWAAVSARIETVRLTAKAAIEAAATVPEIRRVPLTLRWS